MERYIVFMYEMYYPSGGARDIQGTYSTLDEAKVKARSLVTNWFSDDDTIEILDTATGNCIYYIIDEKEFDKPVHWTI